MRVRDKLTDLKIAIPDLTAFDLERMGMKPGNAKELNEKLDKVVKLTCEIDGLLKGIASDVKSRFWDILTRYRSAVERVGVDMSEEDLRKQLVALLGEALGCLYWVYLEIGGEGR